MFFTFHIVVVHESEDVFYIPPKKKIKEEISYMDNITFLPNNKDKLMKCLISLCDTNKCNVIIVTSKSTIMFDVTQKIINKNISTNIVTFVSKLEQKLKFLFHGAVCGIRNETLIINIYGSEKDAVICITTYEKMIDQIIELIIPHHLSYSLYRDEPMTTNITELKSLTEVTDAQKIIRDGIIQSNEKIASKCVRLHDAYGKILLRDIYAKCNVPSFKTSAINGFAVKANDRKNKKKILEAGSTVLEPDTCVRVKTGAFIPDEATAVIKIKNTKTVSHNNWEEIEIIIQPKEGENIKPIGCEIKMGNKILDEHTYIGLAEIELLASCGIDKVEVIESQTVGILSIKNEIGKGEPKEILKHIYDGNKITLITLLKQKDFDTLDFGIVDADMLKISAKVQEALKDVNILVITGFANGRDQLKTTLQNNFNANIYFDRVNMKPGKSTTYGTCMLDEKKKHILYLPGNSATILITAHLFLLPLLNKMHYNDMEVPVIQAHVMDEYKKYSRPNYIWTYLKWDKEEIFARVFSTYGNNNLLRSHNANALLIVPAASGSDKSLLPGTLTPLLFLGSKSFCQNIPN